MIQKIERMEIQILVMDAVKPVLLKKVMFEMEDL